MSEVIERGAKAAYERYRSRYAIVGMPSWEDTPYDKSAFKDYARAVIEAIREPTQGQYDALSATNKLWRDLDSTTVWQTYIDAALKD